MQTLIDLDDYILNIRGSTGALIVGKPGSGKSVLTTYLMLKIMQLGGFALICDAKRSDFYSLKNYLFKRIIYLMEEIGLLKVLIKLLKCYGN
ncbi:MAG: hypothetical protein ACRCZW_03175 [Lactobacillaceae bacterium]